MSVVAQPRPTTDERIRAALWFAEHGFGIFTVWSTTDAGVCRCPLGPACSSAGKHPVTPNGFKDATLDADRIRTLLAAGSHPNYGMLPPEGVFALDVDADDDGIARLGRLEHQHGPLPPTLRTATAHGQHVFLRWPAERPRPLRKMFGYVTRWGSGRQAGYVIGPRSVHATGAVYTPVPGSLEIAELPAQWADLALAGETETVISVGGELPEVGGRHDWLRDRARHYRGLGLSREALRAALLAENDRLSQPKSPDEVDRAIGRVFELFQPDPADELEERVSRRLGDEELGLLDIPVSVAFPPPPDSAAFDGLLGECVSDLMPGTDASPVALLGGLLAMCGVIIPGHAHWQQTHTSSPFVALVGESGVGRKGTAMHRVLDAMVATFDKSVVHGTLLDGINSGEGLVSAMFRRHGQGAYTAAIVFEEEYASLLASRQREGSNLDPKMRVAFDGGQLSNIRSNDQKVVPPPYWLSALIAITPTELQERLEPGALRSGSANRWLYLPVVKRDILSDNSPARFAPPRKQALERARRRIMDTPNPLAVDDDVTPLLTGYAHHLTENSYGIAHDLTKRLHTIAFRIGLVHALVEGSLTVTTSHIRRALALTEYARSGIPWVFRQVVGNGDADLLYRQLLNEGSLSRNIITQQLIRDPRRRQSAIDELRRLKLVAISRIITRGRPRDLLVPVPESGTFVHYVQVLTSANPESAKNLHEMHESAQEAARKLHESRTKLHESPDKSTIECHFFAEHQSEHHWTDDGWVCSICTKGLHESLHETSHERLHETSHESGSES